MNISIVTVNRLITRTNLPASDYVINPYVGCPHACKYCYASFMKRFSHHDEEWGDFIDIKHPKKMISGHLLNGKTVFMSSVTDCYNQYESEYGVTRTVLEQLKNVRCNLHISTKSSLILRDLDILKQLTGLKVAISLNTLDEGFRSDMDRASSVSDRLHTLSVLHKEGIYTVLFMSPIFPVLTDFRELVKKTKSYVDEYWFENLNLRGCYKKTIMDYVLNNHNAIYNIYEKIFNHGDNDFWENLRNEISEFCILEQVQYRIFFYHKRKNPNLGGKK